MLNRNEVYMILLFIWIFSMMVAFGLSQEKRMNESCQQANGTYLSGKCIDNSAIKENWR